MTAQLESAIEAAWESRADVTPASADVRDVVDAALELLDSGARVVAMDDLYGGTRRLFSGVRERSAGLQFSYADLSDPDVAVEAIDDDTAMV